jgi:PAS domain S-box-containing protein
MKDLSRTNKELIQEISILKKKIEGLEKTEAAYKLAELQKESALTALKNSESKYQFLAESMADVVFTLDINMNTTYVSPSIERMLGFTPKERMAQKVDRQLTQKSLKLITERLLEELSREKEHGSDPDRSVTLELECYHKDGSIKNLVTYFRGIRDSKGNLTGFYGSHHDITARKLMEEALRKSEENYRQLYDNSPTAIYQIDFRTGKFLKANDTLCEYLGCSQEEITSLSPYSFLTNDSKKLLSERLEKMSLGEKVTENPEYEVVDKKGKSRWLQLNSKNIYDSEGLAGADVVAHDVTARKQAEEMLIQHNDALSRLNLFSIGLSNLSIEDDLEAFIAAQVKEITGAVAVIFSEYNAENRTTSIRHIEIETGLLEKAVGLIGKQLGDIRSKVSDEMYREMIREKIGMRKTLHEVSFGAISRPVGAAIELLLNVNRFIGVAYLLDGKLYGTSVIAMRKDQPDPPKKILESIIYLATVSLRRKQAENALQESEKRYRLIAENTADLISIMDMNLRFTYLSPAIMRLRGFTVEEAMEQTMDQILTPDSISLILSAYKEEMHLEASGTADPGRIRIMEVENYKKDGTASWVESSLSFLHDREGNPIGILMVTRDISKRKQADEALRISEEKYRFLANNIPDIIYSLDGDGNIVAINDSAFEHYGYSAQDAMGKPFISFVYPEDREILIKSFLKALEEKRKVTIGLKFRIVAENGSSYWFELNARARFDSLGRYIGEDGVLRDITERKKMEEELLRAQKLESIGTLAGGIAHDFNNLMAIVYGHIDLALLDLPLGHSAYKQLQAAILGINQTKDLTNKLITFSCGGSPYKEIFDVSDILRDAVRSKTKGSEVKVTFNLISDLWKAEADELQLRQCFYNLTINALEAMPEGGTLTISAENALVSASEVPGLQQDSYIKIIFTDDGTGIPEEHLSRIFDPYFTTKQMGAQKGAGLGLAVCYAVLKNHNGHITVKSMQGKGTSFILFFPARTEPVK